MYRFIENIGDFFNPGYYNEDFASKVFGIYEKQEDAQKAASALREEGYARMICVTEPFYAGGRNRAAEQGV